MRHREEIIRVNKLPVISRHTQQNFIIVVTANTDDRLRHQTKWFCSSACWIWFIITTLSRKPC
jgi:hypothetical protein